MDKINLFKDLFYRRCMEKYLTYEKNELNGKIKMISSELTEIARYLVMFGQQFEGKRKNMTIEETKKCYRNLEKIMNYLNEFDKTQEMPSFEQYSKDFEEQMKKDIY